MRILPYAEILAQARQRYKTIKCFFSKLAGMERK